MKRKRTPSPAPQRRTSRSPLSPRTTRANNKSPPMSKEVNGEEGNIRRSSRARRLSYPTFHSGFMTQDDVIRNRELQNRETPRHESARSRSSTPDTEDMDAPFFNHVRFSPSAKPSSPARRFSRQRAAASIAKMRLQNVPSEDEQSEFNRRYSRDLRSRRQQERSDNRQEPAPPKRKPNLRSDPEEEEEEEEDEEEEVVENGEANDEPKDKKEERQEEITPRRRSSRRSDQNQNEDAEDERSEVDEDQDKEINERKIRRVTRNRGQVEENEEEEEEEEKKAELDEEDEPLGRRSRRSRGVEESKGSDELSLNSEPLMRRSSRTPKPIVKKDSSSEAEINSPRRASRPKRSRAPVERFGYEATPTDQQVRRRRSNEVRNLDQYSSDEEFVGDGTSRSSRHRNRYNMRDKRRKPTSNRARDTSSSSSSESVDEQRFIKRKNKRMIIERSKLRPMNLSKSDAAKAIFKERQNVGASMADIQPMEMDMGVTFESVGGIDDHVNSLREMVMFPLLYPEMFTKFSMTPPRGVLFYGPPGTGKTLIARALASECSREGRKVAFFMRKGADCLSKWIGESERQLRLLFDQAYVMRPSIIFFDEIDGLAPVRSSRNDQIHSSIVSTLLALMDGLDNRGEIIVIGATNRIENIDPALRRPGRFDRELRFALPTRDSRKAILSLHTKSWQPAVEANLVDMLADKTIGYSGADLRGLCAESALNALRRKYPQVYKTSHKLQLDFDQIKINESDFLEAMERMVPSTHRIQDQIQSPLVPRLRPLLGPIVGDICQKIDEVNKGRDFSFRPRILIRGRPGQCISTYIGPAVLHHLEKLPCHKLDIPSLFSNSARSPEEAMFHIIHEAKRTVPSVLYIPHLLRLWRNVLNDPQREAFLALLSEIQPTAPLIIIAFTEESIEGDVGDIIDEMFDEGTEVVEIRNPNVEQRTAYFKTIFDAATDPPEEEDGHEEEAEDVLKVLPIPESRELTEKEEKRLRRKEDSLLRELRIFLRDIWQKINREQKFFMFRMAVDTEEIYDYLEYVEQPMDFDKMLTRLDNAEYKCAQDFLNDIDLIADNAIKYNSDLNYETNKIICHRARALQDFASALIKADMDTDFEDNCKGIIERRKKLTAKLNNPEEVSAFDPKTNSIIKLNEAEAGTSGSPKRTPSRKKRVRKSRWSSGMLTKKPKPKHKETPVDEAKNEEEADLEMEQDNAEDSDTDGEITLNETKELKIDFKKMQQIQDDLISRTNTLTTDTLERIFTKLMECVHKYKKVYDRTDLPNDLTSRLDSLHILPPKSTPAKKRSSH